MNPVIYYYDYAFLTNKTLNAFTDALNNGFDSKVGSELQLRTISLKNDSDSKNDIFYTVKFLLNIINSIYAQNCVDNKSTPIIELSFIIFFLNIILFSIKQTYNIRAQENNINFNDNQINYIFNFNNNITKKNLLEFKNIIKNKKLSPRWNNLNNDKKVLYLDFIKKFKEYIN
jgi:hypothetical protein